MVTQSKTFTASEIGLMHGFPPPPDKRATHDNQLLKHLYIQPTAKLVVAKFASYPMSAPNGEEFYSAFAAFPALAKALT